MMLSEREIKRIHQSMEGMSPYLARPVREHLHLRWAYNRLWHLFHSNKDRFYTILDMGCGIGLLGAYLMRLRNITYIGTTKRRKGLQIGKAMFSRLNCDPDYYMFIQKNIEEGSSSSFPRADVFVFMGYEDEFGDYQRLYEVSLGYREVFLSIISSEMKEYTIRVGCDPPFYFIPEGDFKSIFQESFILIEKLWFPRGRIVYRLRRKG